MRTKSLAASGCFFFIALTFYIYANSIESVGKIHNGQEIRDAFPQSVSDPAPTNDPIKPSHLAHNQSVQSNIYQSSTAAAEPDASKAHEQLSRLGYEAQALLSQKTSATQTLRYAALFKALKLSPEEIEKFKQAEAAREHTDRDLTAIMVGQKLTASDPVIQEISNEAATERNTALKGIVDSRLLDAYDRQSPIQDLVSKASVLAAQNGTRVSYDSRKALVELLASTSTSYSEGRIATLDTIPWDIIEKEVLAKQILTSEQFSTLRQVKAEFDGRKALDKALQPKT